MNNIDKWHRLFKESNINGVEALLDKSVVFYSPVVFKGQEGRKLTALYLQTAYNMFFSGDNQSFQYVRELNTNTDSVLEFTCEIKGVLVNGIDMIKWNDQGKIVEFKVMIRPYKAIELVKGKMLKLLGEMSTMDKVKLKAASVLDSFKK